MGLERLGGLGLWQEGSTSKEMITSAKLKPDLTLNLKLNLKLIATLEKRDLQLQ